MNISDEFQAQIKAGNIADALAIAISGAVELEITTSVTSNQNPHHDSRGDRMRTRINIVDGQIDNEVGSKFIGNGPYTELRKFHLQQVHEGREVIQRNLENLQQMFTILTTTIAQLPPESLSPTIPQMLSPVEQDDL
jgi:hypothetical protein